MNMTILLVEDMDVVAGAIVAFLEMSGYTMLRARSGEEGLALFREHTPDAVITDNSMAPNMTGMTGLQVAVQVKQESPSTPVIMLSAVPPEDAGRICDAVLRKPSHLRRLEAVLRQMGITPGR